MTKFYLSLYNESNRPGSFVLGLYDSEEKAQNTINKHRKNYFDYFIMEIELNKLITGEIGDLMKNA